MIGDPYKIAETMNGALFFDLMFAFGMFAFYVAEEIRTKGYTMNAQAALAISTTLLGEAVIRGWFWLWRFQMSKGMPVEWMYHWPTVKIGVFIEMLGVLCLIRVFSPVKWSGVSWLAIGCASTIVAALLAFGRI